MSVCLFVCMSVCLYVCMSVCLYVYVLSVCLYTSVYHIKLEENISPTLKTLTKLTKLLFKSISNNLIFTNNSRAKCIGKVVQLLELINILFKDMFYRAIHFKRICLTILKPEIP